MNCFDLETAGAYAMGHLDPPEADRCAAHVVECETCRALVQEASQLIQDVRQDLLFVDEEVDETDPPSVDELLTGEGQHSAAGPRLAVNAAAKRSSPWSDPDVAEMPDAAGHPGHTPEAGDPARNALRWLRRAAERLAARPFLPRLAASSIAVILCLAGAVWIVWLRPPAVSAAELIRQAAAADRRAATGPMTIHRVYTLVERQPDSDLVLSRQRVELWRRGRTVVRRLHDERGRLLAGEWIHADGSRTLYRRDVAPTTHGIAATRPVAFTESDPWLLEPSATDLLALVPSLDTATVEEESARFIVQYRASPSDDGPVLAATLAFSKADRRLVAQILHVRTRQGPRLYQLSETAYRQVPPAAVPEAAFRPDRELAGPPLTGRTVPVPGRAVPVRLSESALLGLEVQVLSLLNEAGALLGEQVSVSRTDGGRITVEAMVETEARRAALLVALEPLEGSPAIEVSVKTFAGALTEQGSSQTDAVRIREFQVARNRIPVGEELRHHFLGAGRTGADIDEKVRQFAAARMAESRDALMHAWAIKRLTGRYDPPKLKAMTPDALSTWQELLREHADGVRAQTIRLRQAVGPVFFADRSNAETSWSSARSLDHRIAVERLLELAQRQDEIIRAAFATSDTLAQPVFMQTEEFWRLMAEVESVAESLTRAP